MPLAEHDARALVSAVVAELLVLGATVRNCGVQRDGDGLLFLADLNGRVVFCQTPPGTVPYRTVAMDLLSASGVLAPALKEH